MIEVLAVVLPFAVALATTRLYHFDVTQYFSGHEQRNLKKLLTPPIKEEIINDTSAARWGALFIGIPIAAIQYALIYYSNNHQAPPVFSYHSWDLPIYALIPALFLSMLATAAIVLTKRKTTWPDERMRKYLLMKAYGMSYYSFYMIIILA